MLAKNRFLSLLVCAVFGLIGGIISNLGFLSMRGVNAHETSVIKSQRFEVVDRDGRLRAVLGTDEQGFASYLTLHESDGKEGMGLTTRSLVFLDETRRDRIRIGVWRDASPSMSIERNGKTIWNTP